MLIGPDQPLVPSVLDRLIDHEPGNSREPTRSRNQILRELKASVCRDLENLLNTRVRCVPWQPGLKEVQQSLANYGIPDITAASLGTEKERQEFCQVLRTVILQYERRLKKLEIRLKQGVDLVERSVTFQIDAVLQAEPAPEPITFESSLNLPTGTFRVKGKGKGDE